MESGPDTNLSETQTPKLVEAGALRPWTTGDLPPAPEGGLAYWKKAVGPGLLLAGASLGAGEWLFGPAVTAQYGAVLLWLAFLSIASQLFVNLEMVRYTLYSGEPIFVGFFRTRPGPRIGTPLFPGNCKQPQVRRTQHRHTGRGRCRESNPTRSDPPLMSAKRLKKTP